MLVTDVCFVVVIVVLYLFVLARMVVDCKAWLLPKICILEYYRSSINQPVLSSLLIPTGGGGGGTQTQTERQGKRQTGRQTVTDTDTQRDKQRERHTERQGQRTPLAISL